MRYLAWLLALLLAVPACGVGAVETSGPDIDDARVVLQKLMVASLKGNQAVAEPHLDVGSFLMSMDSPEAFKLNELSAEKRAEHTKSAFDQIAAALRWSSIVDESGVISALRGASFNLLGQTRSLTVLFEARDKEKPKEVVKYKVRMMQTPGGIWKLIVFDPVF